jgi:hypothetical protein
MLNYVMSNGISKASLYIVWLVITGVTQRN